LWPVLEVMKEKYLINSFLVLFSHQKFYIQDSNWVFPDNKSCYLGPDKKPERTFTFDGVSPPEVSQEEFYESFAKETIIQLYN